MAKSPTPDLSELDEIRRVKRHFECNVSSMVETLSETDRAAFEAGLADSTRYSSGVLSDFLKRRGFDINHQQMHRHREQSCSCFRGRVRGW